MPLQCFGKALTKKNVFHFGNRVGKEEWLILGFDAKVWMITVLCIKICFNSQLKPFSETFLNSSVCILNVSCDKKMNKVFVCDHKTGSFSSFLRAITLIYIITLLITLLHRPSNKTICHINIDLCCVWV